MFGSIIGDLLTATMVMMKIKQKFKICCIELLPPLVHFLSLGDIMQSKGAICRNLSGQYRRKTYLFVSTSIFE